jgi:hypothetical protein
MAAVLNNTYCTACGGRHTLCYLDDDIIFSNRDYEYDCPATRRTVPLPHQTQTCEVVNLPPKGAAIIRQVKH